MNNEPVAWMHHCLKSGIGYLSYTKPPPLDDYKPIPLYIHPAKTLRHENHDLDRGAWTVGQTESQEFIESSDFNHDVRLYLNGDFETDAQRLNYLQHIADRLNTHPAKTLTNAVVNELWAESQEDGIAMQQGFTTQQHYFAYLILRKAK